MNYRVVLVREEYATIDVEADDEQEAWKKAKQKAENSDWQMCIEIGVESVEKMVG